MVMLAEGNLIARMNANLDEKPTAYREFWSGTPRKRPLIGVDAGGWFPFKRFSCLRNIEDGDEITDSLIRLVSCHHEAAGDFFGGHFIEQYGLWAPGPLVRMQEDETAVYSPRLYKEIILEQDRKIARSFPYSLIHLHTSSLFLLESVLSIHEINVFEINKDICEMGIPDMLPFLKRIQEEGRQLVIRGPLTKDDFLLIRRHLAPEGLILQTVVDNEAEVSDILDSFRTLYRG